MSHTIARLLALGGVLVAAPLRAQAVASCRTGAPDAAERIARLTATLYPPVLLTGDSTPRSLEARMRALRVPGVSVTVIEGDRIAWSRAWGVRDVESRLPATVHTRFQAASLSKPMATLGVMQLVRGQRLGLDDDVRQHPRTVSLTPSPYLDSGTVTPRLLLSHRAGVAVSGFLGYAQTDSVPTLAQIIAGAKPANHPALAVNSVPGRENRYSGGGYTIMEQALEDISGERFETYLQRAVLTPLGTTRSTYATLAPGDSDDIASGHHGAGTIVPGGWRTHPERAAAALWTTSCDDAQAVIAMQRAARGALSPLDSSLVRSPSNAVEALRATPEP